ncbi:MAG: hypothetical protein O9284_00605 [Steroidobacteraceae bacterium]|jgi:hypothetical protein|nr:hypothetical protein [Steroidobacteraceae bacterium]
MPAPAPRPARRLARARSLPLVALLLALAPTVAVLAADLPPPRVMSDAPAERGAWRMEMLEVNGAPPQGAQAFASGLTVCTTAAQAMSRGEQAGRSRCESRYLENTAERAVMEVSCTGDPPTRTRSTVTRDPDGTGAYRVETESVRGDRTDRARLRLVHAGPCGRNDGVISLGKDSPVCRNAAAQLAEMDPAKRCTGDDRAECERTIAQMRARVESLCK